MTHVKTWVKISKVMPQPKSIPPGKGGKPYGKRSKSLIYNMVWLNRTYYSLFKLQAKFSKIVFPSQIPANYANSAQFAPTVHEFRKIHTFYIMFQTPAPAENPAKFQRITQIPRSSPIQSANHAKFAHFVNLFYIMFQAPASTKNAQQFQRITQILRNSPTQSANYAKFAPFANTTPYVSDA